MKMPWNLHLRDHAAACTVRRVCLLFLSVFDFFLPSLVFIRGRVQVINLYQMTAEMWEERITVCYAEHRGRTR